MPQSGVLARKPETEPQTRTGANDSPLLRGSKVQSMRIKFWGVDPQPGQLQRHALTGFSSRLESMRLARRWATYDGLWWQVSNLPRNTGTLATCRHKLYLYPILMPVIAIRRHSVQFPFRQRRFGAVAGSWGSALRQSGCCRNTCRDRRGRSR